MIKKESRYIIRRIIIGVGISLVLMLIRSLPVHAASCDPATLNITYKDGNTWYNMNDPLVYSGVDKISYKFQNNNIGNNNVTSTTNITINTSQNITTNDIKIYSDTNGNNNITNNCSISVSGSVPNSNIPQIRSVQLFEKGISIACNYTPNNGNALNVVIALDQATIENVNIYGCLKINPNDTEQLLNGMAQNTNNIVEEMNYNANINQNQLNDIENAIEEMFPNFGSCRRMGHVILTKNKALDSNGNEVDNNNYGISGMIRVYPTDTLDRMKPSADNVYACFYGNMNQLIECQTERQVINYQIPADAYYVRFTWSQIDDSPETYHCSKDDQMVQNAIDEAADSINKFRDEYNSTQQVCNYVDMNIAKQYYNNNTIILMNNASSQTNYIFEPGKYKVESKSNEASLYFRTGTSTGAISKGNQFPIEIESDENFNIWYWKSSEISQDLFNSIKVYKYTCKNGNQGIYQYLSDTNVGNTGVGFFDNFSPGNMHGLGNIVALPLDFVSSLNNTCQPIEFPSIDMYSYHFQLTIPCLSSFVYDSLPSSLIDILRLLINGFIVYRILKWLFDFIIELRDPDYDELEVMDL